MTAPRSALVVGAGSAIGAAVVAALAADGFACREWGRDPARLGRDADRVDLRAPDQVEAALSRLPDRLDAVVLAAGLFDWAPADEGDPDVWDELVMVNLASAMRVTRGVLPRLLAAAPSSLVLIGSSAARTAFAGNPAYVASKHGLAGFARSVFLRPRPGRVGHAALAGARRSRGGAPGARCAGRPAPAAGRRRRGRPLGRRDAATRVPGRDRPAAAAHPLTEGGTGRVRAWR